MYFILYLHFTWCIEDIIYEKMEEMESFKIERRVLLRKFGIGIYQRAPYDVKYRIITAQIKSVRRSFLYQMVKVKVTPVQELRFCTGRTSHRGSRGIALLFLGHGTRRAEGSASHSGCS